MKSEIFILTAQSIAFVSEKQFRHNANPNTQSVSYAQVTSSAKVYENNSEIDHVTAQSIEFHKTFDPIKQTEKMVRPYQATNFELIDIEFVKKVLHGYHASYFSYANLQMSLKAVQHSSNELEIAVTIMKQVFTFTLVSKK